MINTIDVTFFGDLATRRVCAGLGWDVSEIYSFTWGAVGIIAGNQIIQQGLKDEVAPTEDEVAPTKI